MWWLTPFLSLSLSLSLIILYSLLSQVAVQNIIQVVDVTHNSKGVVIRRGSSDNNDNTNDNDSDNIDEKTRDSLLVALPKNLKQYEIRSPAEDKDVFCYYFLHKVRIIWYWTYGRTY